jgi:GNAT superfamily N-acetyltransferase
MQVSIREAIKEDLKGILRLYDQPSMDKGNVISIEKAGIIFDKMSSYPDYKVYVAFLQEEMVGTFALAVMDNLGHNGDTSGVIEDVVVLEDKQGRGIGRQMMEYAVALCKNKSCYKVMLSSNIKREAAHKFYESLGFKKHGYSFLIEL